MAAPTLLDYAESTYTGTGTTETTDDLNWNASGDRIVVLGASEVNSTTIATPTGTGLTLAALTGTPTNTASSCKAYGWEDTAAADGNTVISATVSANQGAGISAWAFSNVDSVQNPVVLVNTAAVVSMTVVADSSVVMILADFDATTDVTVTTSPVGGTIREATNNSGRFTVLVIEWHNQSAGTRNYGVTAWTGTGTISKVAVEVRGAAGGATDLVSADAAHVHAADQPALTQAHALTSTDAGHAHTVEQPALTQAHVLVAQDASHTHAADQPALIQVHALTAGDSAHAHLAEQPALTQVHQLTAADATQAQAADNVDLELAGTVAAQDARHGHTAESPALTQAHVIAVDAATHQHAAEQPALTQVHMLATGDALHGHTADEAAFPPDDVAVGAGGYITASTPVGRITASTPPRYTTSTGGGRL